MPEIDLDDHDHNKPVPKIPLIAMGILFFFVLGLIVLARFTPLFDDPGPQPTAVETVPVTLAVQMDGTVVISSPDGAELVRYDPAHSGFLQGMLRALKRQRDRAEVSYAEPYDLSRMSDGRMRLIDPYSGMEIDLQSFGPTNAETLIRAFNAGQAHAIEVDAGGGAGAGAAPAGGEAEAGGAEPGPAEAMPSVGVAPPMEAGPETAPPPSSATPAGSGAAN